MIQSVKALAINPDDPTLTPETHMVEQENILRSHSVIRHMYLWLMCMF